jgi:hypothetical protein
VHRVLKIALVTLLFSIPGYAQVDNEAAQQILEESLEWLARAQEKETIKDSIFRGEWPSTIALRRPTFSMHCQKFTWQIVL